MIHSDGAVQEHLYAT